jgi:DNA-binding NarL/FixJ family response regulator
MSTTRVLVVDDFEPFRDVVCSILQSAGLSDVGQAADGLRAVRETERLQPDLVLLDIGLPGLNGIEAGRRIRQVAPRSAVLFISQESSPDVVQAALEGGALGYVHKSRVQRELLPAIESVLAGKQFVSCGLRDPNLQEGAKTRTRHAHEIFFFSDDSVLVDGFARFIAAAVDAGKPVMTITTNQHRKALLERLGKQGVPVNASMLLGACVWLDAAQAAPREVVDVVTRFIQTNSKTANGSQTRLALCGELAGRLWAEGRMDEALQIEHFCNELASKMALDILCAYPLGSFQGEILQSLKKVSDQHSGIFSS